MQTLHFRFTVVQQSKSRRSCSEGSYLCVRAKVIHEGNDRRLGQPPLTVCNVLIYKNVLQNWVFFPG